MKLIYSFIILSASCITIFSQSDSVSVMDTTKVQNDCFVEKHIPPELLKNIPNYFSKIPDRLLGNPHDIKFIPLPPATPSNSKAELLPLHKPDDINIRLLKSLRRYNK